MNIASILAERAQAHPTRQAIVEETRAIDYATLENSAQRAARLLREAGLGPGDRALVFCPMSIELYVALMGLYRIGAVAMFLDPSSGREHIEACCEIGAPTAFIGITRAHLLRLKSRPIRRIPHRFVVGFPVPGATSWSRVRKTPPLVEIAALDAETPALLTFTSGSTGQPKAAMRTHGFLVAQHKALEQTLELREGRIDLTTLPIFLLANLASGMTSVIPGGDLRAPASIDPQRIVTQIQQHRPASTVASPALLLALASHCESRGLQLPSFERLDTGGAPVFPATLERLQRVAPDARVVAVYGSTEAEPIAHIERASITDADHETMRRGGGLITGVPEPSITLRIVRDRWGEPRGTMTEAEFESERVGPGEIGEIVVTGPHVLTGYLGGEGDEETKFRVGETVWHRTGDSGRLDPDGRLWLLGRCVAKVSDEHGVMYPFGVECAAQEHAAVTRAAFVHHGGRRVLIVEPASERRALPLDELVRELSWAHIAEAIAVERIPMDRRHNAKVDYPALRRLLGG